MNRAFVWDVYRKIFGVKVEGVRNSIPTLDATRSDGRALDFFGVFVTVYRRPASSDEETYKVLKERPTKNMDVHGCIGYISPDKSRVDPEFLYEQGLRVGYDSAYTDPRSQLIKLPLDHDPFAVLAVSLMLLPLKEMSPDNTNDEFGLLCEGESGRLTTFLPEVFPGVKLGGIQNNLKKKANSECTQFFQYKVLHQTAAVWDLFLATISIKKLCLASTLDEYFQTSDYIFFKRAADGTLVVNESEIIRNLAAIECARKLCVLGNTMEKLKKNKESIINKYKEKSASGAAADTHTKVSMNTTDTNLCNLATLKKEKKLNDNVFLLGQYGIYFLKKCEGKGSAEISSILDELKAADESQSDIFRLNWYSQLLWETTKRRVSQHNKTNNFLQEHYNYIKNALDKQIINDQDFSKKETNFLAVAFEALCHVLATGQSLYEKSSGNAVATMRLIYYIFTLLEQRCVENCMYKFSSGESRLDITCHIFNGYILLSKLSY